MDRVKIIVEKYSDGYVAYALGLKGIVVGEGDTYEAALADSQVGCSIPHRDFRAGSPAG